MLLYIIYIEPLLMMMRRMTRGLTVSLVQQKDEDYYDDVNFVSERITDLIVIDEVFTNFEDVSGDGIGSMEGKTGLAFKLVESGGYDENLWIPNYSFIQANLGMFV